MVDNFALLLIHGLLALGAWRLFMRDDLDREGGDGAARRSAHRGLRTGPGAADEADA